jgi:membrane-associated phospholipid phosphatase
MTLVNGAKSESTTASFMRRGASNIVASAKMLLRPARIHPRQPWLWPPRKLIIAVAVAVAVFLVGMFLIDAPAITYARTLPRWLVDFFDWITDFGKSGWLLWPLGILFIALAALPRPAGISQRVVAAVMVRVGFLFWAIALPGIATNVIKQVIGRARPFVTGIADPTVFAPFTWGAAYASMPSGHATTAFSVLVAFGILWPRARTALLIYAALICVSRVVLTAHHPTDVLGGAVMGAVGALLVARIFALHRLGFSVKPDGALLAYPGPSFRRIKSVARELLA